MASDPTADALSASLSTLEVTQRTRKSSSDSGSSATDSDRGPDTPHTARSLKGMSRKGSTEVRVEPVASEIAA